MEAGPEREVCCGYCQHCAPMAHRVAGRWQVLHYSLPIYHHMDGSRGRGMWFVYAHGQSSIAHLQEDATIITRL